MKILQKIRLADARLDALFGIKPFNLERFTRFLIVSCLVGITLGILIAP